MGIFTKINKINDGIPDVKDLPKPSQVKSEFENHMAEAADEEVKKPETAQKVFKVKFQGKKYKVPAESEEEAILKIKKLCGIEETVEKVENNAYEIKITVKDIFNAVAEEINRIVTVAHPEVVQNTYDRWIAVLGEEFGEIVHEINDEFEGKKPSKNTFVECVQLASATILLAKKFANEHKDMFRED